MDYLNFEHEIGNYEHMHWTIRENIKHLRKMLVERFFRFSDLLVLS